MYHARVSRLTGLNPIARAVAREKLKSAVRDQKIRLYLTGPGEPCVDICHGVGTTLALLVHAAELEGKAEHPLVRIMRGGISACAQMADADRYNPANTPALDVALDAAIELNEKLNPNSITRACNTFHGAGV